MVVGPSQLSAWWQGLRDTCAGSEHLSAAVMAVLASRAVAGQVTALTTSVSYCAITLTVKFQMAAFQNILKYITMHSCGYFTMF